MGGKASKCIGNDGIIINQKWNSNLVIKSKVRVGILYFLAFRKKKTIFKNSLQKLNEK